MGLAVIALRCMQYGAQRGLDFGTMCQITGESIEELQTQGHYVPMDRVYALYEYLIEQLDNVAVPLEIAQMISIQDLHVMGFAVMTATTGYEAYRRAVRYAQLITDTCIWELIEEDDRAIIRLDRDSDSRLGERAANEAGLADFLQCSRECTGLDYEPLRVMLRHKEPRDSRPYREFFRCPIEWEAQYNQFEISKDMFQLVPRDANPALAQFFGQHAEMLLQERHQQLEVSLVDRVRQEIVDQLPSGQPSLASVAKQMGMSERSLRRYLSAEDTKFSQLLAEVRFERARSLLRTPRTTMSEIAYLLGFSNVSAFSRAFKKWCGSAPGEFRSAQISI
ncbi:MAG: AraC family transcriptional regulator ligand-binding domain-containing protein [Myxococcota bacterium]